MSLNSDELALIAAELNREVLGGVVQKVHAPTTTRLYLEVRIPGRSVQLLVCSDSKVARLSAVTRRPANPATPPAWQSVLRQELTGAKLMGAEVLHSRQTLLLHLERQGRSVHMVLEATSEPTIVLRAADGRVLCLSIPSRRGLRVGRLFVPLEERPLKPSPSRLSGEMTFLRLAHAAQELLATAEQERWVAEQRTSLGAKLKKLERTQEKVRAEIARTHLATQYRKEGELLAQNLSRLERGQKLVTLCEYLEDGSTRDIEVELDPKRTLKQEVEWRFHHSKRMLRGAELGKARLAMLEAKGDELRAELASLASGAGQSLERRPPSQLSPTRPAAAAQPPLPPFREYLGHGGQRIWVGRGAAHNDALTFHLARPFHVWLHARGVAGAHVVIPLEKNAQVPGELLLDAATLAAHHSEAKGEARVEVSHTLIKFVRKPKGARPGAVTYTREKTLLLKFEPARLERLLGSVAEL